MSKMVFLDIDGTIRAFDGTIASSTVEAIKKARANGHKVCVCTGRPKSSISKEVMDIGFDGIITSSGGNVEYEGELISHKVFTQLAFVELMNDLIKKGCVAEVQTGKKNYLLRESEEEYRKVGERLSKRFGIKNELPMPQLVDSIMELPEAEKIGVFSKEMSGKEIMEKWGYAFHIVDSSLPHFESWAGEITPKNVNKAEALRQILVASDYDKSDTIAIGDSINDLEMLRYAKVGVAMGNASEDVKIAADMVTDDINADGIYKAFEKLGLI